MDNSKLIKLNKDNLVFTSLYQRETKLYFGIELEFSGYEPTEHADTVAQKIVSILSDNGIPSNAVYDGSVRGREIVLQPCTYSVLESRASAFVKISRLLNTTGWNNDDGKAGGHIHISRRTMGKSKESQKENIDKMIAFFRKHRQGILKLSRRTASDFNRWCKILDNYDYPTRYDMQDRYPSRRYQAINLCNKNTVEFRIFTAFTTKNDILGALQFVNLVATTAKAKHKDLLSYESLDAFIEDHSRSHRELADYWRSL